MNTIGLNINEPSDAELERVTGGTSPDPTPHSSAAAAARAQQELGKPYAWGAVGPAAYDASGFVSYCLTGIHARIGSEQTFMGWPRVSDPQPGDVCVSSTHCGIYMSPGSMIHAPGMGASVSRGSIQSGMIIVRRP